MNKKTLIMPPLVLTIICLVVTAALVLTYQFTKPYIEAAAVAAADAARQEVFPGDYSFEQQQLQLDGLVEAYAAIDGNSETAGYVITAASKGFGGLVNVMVGLDTEGNITGVKMMDNNETPGLGTKVGEVKYTSKFLDKNVETYKDVAAISGATITSNAFKSALAIAMDAYGMLVGGGK